jgi:glutaconate CoA-transferase, subunit A
MELLGLSEAIERYVRDGQSVAMEGFTHLIPFAAGHEIIRQRRRDLHLIRMTPDLIYDQMIGMGCASRMTFSWGGNPGVGSLHRFRDAVVTAWPAPLSYVEYSHAEMAVAYQAGASGLPCGLMRRYADTDLRRVAGAPIKAVECPFTGASLSAIPAINPDVTLLHAHQVDAAGNVLIRGILGAAKEAAMAAHRLLVTVEERVERFDTDMNAVVLPAAIIAAVSVVRGGAYPSYAQGCYARDNRFYIEWEEISRERGSFSAWMEKYVLGARDHTEHLEMLGVAE